MRISLLEDYTGHIYLFKKIIVFFYSHCIGTGFGAGEKWEEYFDINSNTGAVTQKKALSRQDTRLVTLTVKVT